MSFVHEGAIYPFYIGVCYTWLVHWRVLHVVCTREGGICGSDMGGCCASFLHGRVLDIYMCGGIYPLYIEGFYISLVHMWVLFVVLPRGGAVYRLYTGGC